MPLVKQGKIVADGYIHVADDAEIPVDGAALVPARVSSPIRRRC